MTMFYEIILLVTTSALSSTNLWPILIFASWCVLLYRSPVFSKFHKLKLDIRLHYVTYHVLKYDY